MFPHSNFAQSRCSPLALRNFQSLPKGESFLSPLPHILNSEISYDISILRISSVLQELEEFWVYRALLGELTKKLTYCVKAELIPLMEVTGVLEVSDLLAPQLR